MWGRSLLRFKQKERKKGSFVRKLRVHWRIHATATVSRTISIIGDHAIWILIGLIRPHLLDEEEVEHWGEAMDKHPVQNFEGSVLCRKMPYPLKNGFVVTF